MDIIFQYKFGGEGFGCAGMPGGTSITVYSNGDIVQGEYYFGVDEPFKKKTLATSSELAKSLQKIITKYADQLKSIPDSLDNGTLDAPGDYFTFGNKKIVAWNITRLQRADTYPEYYEVYKDNIAYENEVLDIYDEIAKEINKYIKGFQLEIK